MKPEEFGYRDFFEKYRTEQQLTNFEVGRVIAEHKERYVVKTIQGDLDAEITGNLRFTARNREDFPAVGDWVSIQTYDEAFGIIHRVFPRFSTLARPAVGKFGELQIIATNIDYAFLVQATDRDFNVNRFERYLTLCHTSRVIPVIVLTKTDLISEDQKTILLSELQQRIPNVPVFAVSNETREGFQELMSSIKKQSTYCLLGSSGVGKSTLLNNLLGKTHMPTSAISESTHKGRHTTSHRELIVLENGGILIDNPGMREVGIYDNTDGLETTFDQIAQLARQCRFPDCSHTHEKGCAVTKAVEDGILDERSYENFRKMEKENSFFESSLADRKKKEKVMGKILKDYQQKDVKGKNTIR